MFWTRIILVLVFYICIIHVQGVQASNAEGRLWSNLFRNYNSKVRPVIYKNETVEVTLGISILRIEEVVERSQILIIQTWMRQSWLNTHLTWNADEYDGIADIKVPSQDVWHPDIVVYNSAGEYTMPNTNIIVSKNGGNHWYVPLTIRSTCEMDTSDFPFDQHKCKLKFMSWTYHSWDLSLKLQGKADTGYYMANSEWILDGGDGVLQHTMYSCCVETYPHIGYSFTLKRKPRFYVWSLLVPMSILAAIAPFAFLVSGDAGIRIMIPMSSILGLILLVSIASSLSIPLSSARIPFVGRLFLSLVSELACMVVLLCVTTDMYRKSYLDAPLPGIARRFLLMFGPVKSPYGNLGRHEFDDTQQILPADSQLEMREVVGDIIGKPDHVAKDEEVVQEWRALAKKLDLGMFFFFIFLFVITIAVLFA